jgi:hypothetical protein
MDAAEAVEKLGRWRADQKDEDRAYARAAGFTMGDHKIVTNMRDFTPKIARDSFVYLCGRIYHVDSMGPKQIVLSQVSRWRAWDAGIFKCTYNDGAGGQFTSHGSDRRSTVEFLDDRPVLVPFGCVCERSRGTRGA